MKALYIIALLWFITVSFIADNEFCGIRNTAFQQGETINYTVYYSVIGIYINAGTATFAAGLENFAGKPVYHVVGTGSSNPSYDWIFKVRDKYESYIDTGNLQPQKFIRNIDEGGFKQTENVTFINANNTAITAKGSFPVPNCVQDVLSAIYYARNIDFNKYKPNDKIPFNMFLDNEVYGLYVKYLGKETIKTKYGKFNAIKFKPLLVKGTIFQGGEKMDVWVTDDANHIPIRIESPITVGSVKVDMMGYGNLRHPMTSLISKN
ncbi:DUF3108 domain-containing protein [Parasediminibacterium sp. JCM 36343]|uniref:DUF3108 domain-containing protein n=1 Tax=Parasediminibacterium sp. JCM 36343 TaxID=3374279 RepID=UPI00397BA0E2